MGHISLCHLAGAVAGGLLLTLGACGGGEPRSPVDDRKVADGESRDAHLTVTFDITGGTTIKGSVTTPVPSGNLLKAGSCADYAAGFESDGRTRYPVPSLMSVDSVDGHQVLVEAFVEDYNGPGTYPADTLSGFGNGANIMVDKQVLYQVLTGVTDAQIVTDGNGGGTWTFINLRPGDHNKPGIDGAISWTCNK